MLASDLSIKLLERLAYQINVTVHSHHPEPIHELRVAVRRFQQALALFKHHFPSRELKKMKRRLKDLMDRSGPIRDCDIATKILTKSQLEGAAPLKASIGERRKEAVGALVAALRRWSVRR